MSISNQVRFGQLLFNNQPYAEVREEAREALKASGFEADVEVIEEGLKLVQPQVDALHKNGIDVVITPSQDRLNLSLQVDGKELVNSSDSISSTSVNTPLSVVNVLQRETDALKRFATNISDQLQTVRSDFLSQRSSELKAEKNAANAEKEAQTPKKRRWFGKS